MLLDDNCIRPDKIPDSGFPLVCQAEMSRYANIRADHTTFYLLFPPFPTKNSRSSGITELLADGSSAGVCHIGSNCLHIWWTTAPERRARITVTFFNIVPLWSRCTSVHKILSWNQYLLTEISRFLSPNNYSDVDIYTTMYFLYKFTFHCVKKYVQQHCVIMLKWSINY